ncbi:unnamed protein product [Arabidopsis lyrata]|nr:unnamed protein product [Arabidopsis lyrata]
MVTGCCVIPRLQCVCSSGYYSDVSLFSSRTYLRSFFHYFLIHRWIHPLPLAFVATIWIGMYLVGFPIPVAGDLDLVVVASLSHLWCSLPTRTCFILHQLLITPVRIFLDRCLLNRKDVSSVNLASVGSRRCAFDLGGLGFQILNQLWAWPNNLSGFACFLGFKPLWPIILRICWIWSSNLWLWTFIGLVGNLALWLICKNQFLSISSTESPKQQSLYSRSAPTARNDFSSVFFASPFNRRRCFVCMGPSRRSCSAMGILLFFYFENPVLENRENIWDQILRRKTKLIHTAGNHSLLWPLVSGFNMSIFKIGSMYQGDKGMTGMFTMDLLFSDSILSSPEERHGFNFLFVERETFSASIPHWRSKFLLCLLLMRSLVELQNSLFSLMITYTPSSLYHKRRELIDLQLPTHLITNLSVESRIFSGVLRRSLPPCTTAKLSSASSAGSAASPNLLRPMAFGCNKSVFKVGKMNQGGQGMIGILTLDLSFPDSINSSREDMGLTSSLMKERPLQLASLTGMVNV